MRAHLFSRIALSIVVEDWIVSMAIIMFFIGIAALGIIAIVIHWRRMSAMQQRFHDRDKLRGEAFQKGRR
jgi:formate-dependent nitrite reductase membrane component NrfD